MEEKLLEILNYVQKKNDKQVIKDLNTNLSLRNDLKLDSLDLAELTVRIEDEFDVDIFEDGIIDSIDEILTIIRRK